VYREMTLCKGRTTHPIESGFRGLDLDDNQAAITGHGEDRAYISNGSC